MNENRENHRNPENKIFRSCQSNNLNQRVVLYRTHLGSFIEIQSLQESRFQDPNNYKGSGDRKIRKNDCQNHKTQMDLTLVAIKS